MPRKPVEFGDDRLGGGEAFLEQGDEVVGHAVLELDADDAAAPAPLDRAAEIADEILRFLLDLDVAVADDPEGAAAEQLGIGKEGADVAPDQRLDGDVARRSRRACGRSAAGSAAPSAIRGSARRTERA